MFLSLLLHIAPELKFLYNSCYCSFCHWLTNSINNRKYTMSMSILYQRAGINVQYSYVSLCCSTLVWELLTGRGERQAHLSTLHSTRGGSLRSLTSLLVCSRVVFAICDSEPRLAYSPEKGKKPPHNLYGAGGVWCMEHAHLAPARGGCPPLLLFLFSLLLLFG